VTLELVEGILEDARNGLAEAKLEPDPLTCCVWIRHRRP
jgi:hypothetical protein